MTKEEWMKCTDINRMFDFLYMANHRDRCTWYFVPACCRRVWHLLGKGERNAVEVLERYAERKASWSEVEGIREGHLEAVRLAKVREHPDILRDIVGLRPFETFVLEPQSRSPTVQRLAQAIYTDRTFAQLPILADALEEAGCQQAEVLNHLRSGTEHVRGCWALDLVLGRE